MSGLERLVQAVFSLGIIEYAFFSTHYMNEGMSPGLYVFYFARVLYCDRKVPLCERKIPFCRFQVLLYKFSILGFRLMESYPFVHQKIYSTVYKQTEELSKIFITT